jgi:hypothetical protein
MWVHKCMEFIHESCQSESMKSVAKITHVSKLCTIILFLALCCQSTIFILQGEFSNITVHHVSHTPTAPPSFHFKHNPMFLVL